MSGADSSGYMRAVNEVRKWLTYKQMEEFVYLLVDNGYDDLSAIALANEDELQEFEQLFRTDQSKTKIRQLVTCLQQITVEQFRASTAPFARAIADAEARHREETLAAIFALNREGYLSLKRVPTETEWMDKYCVLEQAELKWLRSKKNRDQEGSLKIGGSSVRPHEKDPNNIIIVPANADRLAYSHLELCCEDASDATEWLAVLEAASNAPAPAVPQNLPALPKRSAKDKKLSFLRKQNSHFHIGINADDVSQDDSKSVRGKRTNTQADRKARRYTKVLSEGAIFKKYKNGKGGNKRMIWCTENFDHVLWGDEDKGLVRGFIRSSELQSVTQGFGEQKSRVYLTGVGRTLELDAKSVDVAKEWHGAFEFLIQMVSEGHVLRTQLMNDTEYKNEVDTKRREYAAVLGRGEIFKKWPHKMAFHKSSSVRKVWASDDLKTLQWGDISTLKVKGSCEMADIVDINDDPDESNELKFTIIAKDRSLHLEAKSMDVKNSWVEMLRFMISLKELS